MASLDELRKGLLTFQPVLAPRRRHRPPLKRNMPQDPAARRKVLWDMVCRRPEGGTLELWDRAQMPTTIDQLKDFYFAMTQAGWLYKPTKVQDIKRDGVEWRVAIFEFCPSVKSVP